MVWSWFVKKLWILYISFDLSLLKLRESSSSILWDLLLMTGFSSIITLLIIETLALPLTTKSKLKPGAEVCKKLKADWFMDEPGAVYTPFFILSI